MFLFICFQLRWPRIATFFYKLQLFSTNRNFFLQITTIFYKSQLFSTNLNIFLEIATIFYHLANFFYSLHLFSTTHNFSINHNNFLQPFLAKLLSARGGSRLLALMSNFSTQGHMFYPYLPSEWFVIPAHYWWCVWGHECWECRP